MPLMQMLQIVRHKKLLFVSYFLFQDLYRVLLTAESEGILDDVNMTQVKKLLLETERQK